MVVVIKLISSAAEAPVSVESPVSALLHTFSSSGINIKIKGAGSQSLSPSP